jgi:hypothetical protein
VRRSKEKRSRAEPYGGAQHITTKAKKEENINETISTKNGKAIKKGRGWRRRKLDFVHWRERQKG